MEELVRRVVLRRIGEFWKRLVAGDKILGASMDGGCMRMITWFTVRRDVLIYSQMCQNREKEASSTYCELRAIEEGLRVHGKSLRGKIVRWGCDNRSAGKIMKWGSMKRDDHGVAIKIEELCRRF